jgi:hypothetical protein
MHLRARSRAKVRLKLSGKFPEIVPKTREVCPARRREGLGEFRSSLRNRFKMPWR